MLCYPTMSRVKVAYDCQEWCGGDDFLINHYEIGSNDCI